MLAACLELEGKTADVEADVIVKSESFDVDIQRIVGECAQVDVGTDVADVQMGGRELLRRWDVLLVVSDARMADDQGVDAQVEGGVTGGIARCQRVEHELEVGCSVGVATVESGMCAEELCR